MQSPAFLNRPFTIGDLLDWTIRIYRARFGKLLLITAIFFVPIGLISGLITGQAMTGYLNIMMAFIQSPDIVPNEQMFNDLQNNDGIIVALSCLLMPASLLATGIVSLALSNQILAVMRKEEPTVKESILMGWRRFWSWLGMYLTMLAAYLGVTLLLVIALASIGIGVVFAFGSALGDGIANSDPNFALMTGLIFGILCLYGLIFLVFFGPFIYLYTRWTVAVPGIADQGWGAIESLRESWILTKGNVWRCLIYNLLLYLFYGVLYGMLTAVSFGGAAIVLTTSSWASVAIFTIIGAILPILWQPIQIAAYVMLYIDLRIRNEGYDLELRIAQLEDEVGRDASVPL